MKTIKLSVVLISLIAWLVCVASGQEKYSKKKYDKYYITIPFNYKMNDSIIVYVEKTSLFGRIEAMCSFGATVWTEKEWKDMQKIRRKWLLKDKLDTLKLRGDATSN